MWLLYALTAAALWGLEYALVERILGERYSPLVLVSLQMLVGAVVLGTLALRSGGVQKELGLALSNRGDMALILLSTLVFTAGNYMIAKSIDEGNAVVAGFVEISYPVFIILFSLALGWGHAISWRTVLGGVIVLCGIMLLKQDV